MLGRLACAATQIFGVQFLHELTFRPDVIFMDYPHKEGILNQLFDCLADINIVSACVLLESFPEISIYPNVWLRLCQESLPFVGGRANKD